MKYYRIIAPAIFVFMLALPAAASQISGTVSAGTATSTTQNGSSGQVGGTVASSTSSGSVGGTVASPNSGGGGGSGSSGGGGGSILASGAGEPNPLPGATPSTGTIPVTGGGNAVTTTTTTVTPATYYPSTTPIALGGAGLTSGGSAITAATSEPEIFGANQPAAAASSGLGDWWFAIAAGIILILGIGWVAYLEFY